MLRIVPFTFCLSLPFTLMSQQALADLTPLQVWSDWKQYMQNMGYQINATETAQGNDLRIENMTLSFNALGNEGGVAMTLGTVVYAQNSDGTVAIRTPEKLPLSITARPEVPGGDDFTLDLTISQTGHSSIASGTPEQITYSHTAATLAVNLNALTVAKEIYGAENARFNMSISDLASQTTITAGDKRGYAQNGSLGAMTYDVFINNPEETAQVTLNGGVESIMWQGGGTIPSGIAEGADMAAMIREGFDVTGDFRYANGNTQMTVVDPVNGGFATQSSSVTGELGFKIGPDGLAYNGSQNNLGINVAVDGLPFPITLQMERGGFDLTSPVLKSDVEQSFAFGLELSNFTMSDMIWGIFDPTGQLPRDPATLEIDTTGKAVLSVDLLDAEAAANMAGENPGELRALTLHKILLDAAGAVLQGSGDVTLDNNDKTTLPGMPKPTGAVEFSLEGGNGLLDKLVAMGIIPQEQAMGARMMMGLFAVPGGAPDTLNSRIEFTQDGQILANGQRIR